MSNHRFDLSDDDWRIIIAAKKRISWAKDSIKDAQRRLALAKDLLALSPKHQSALAYVMAKLQIVDLSDYITLKRAQNAAAKTKHREEHPNYHYIRSDKEWTKKPQPKK